MSQLLNYFLQRLQLVTRTIHSSSTPAACRNPVWRKGAGRSRKRTNATGTDWKSDLHCFLQVKMGVTLPGEPKLRFRDLVSKRSCPNSRCTHGKDKWMLWDDLGCVPRHAMRLRVVESAKLFGRGPWHPSPSHCSWPSLSHGCQWPQELNKQAPSFF